MAFRLNHWPAPGRGFPSVRAIGHVLGGHGGGVSGTFVTAGISVAPLI